MLFTQKIPTIGAIEVKDKTRRRCRGWCSRTCIIIAVGVILFLIAAAIAGIIAAAVENGTCITIPSSRDVTSICSHNSHALVLCGPTVISFSIGKDNV